MIGLDLKDKKIIYELDNDSRQTFNKIAKKVGLSKDTVNYRIKKLEKEGYILGYQTLIDFTKIGYTAVRFHISLISTPPNKEKEIIDYLVKNPKVFLVSETEGASNIIFGILIKETSEINDFEENFEKSFKRNIKEIKFGIYTEVFHFNRDYLVSTKDSVNKKISMKVDKKVNVNYKDISILKMLSKNSRIPIINLAEKLKMNANTIAWRIKSLEKNKVILGYKILFGFNKINYIYIKADLILSDFSKEKEIVNFCENHRNIIYVVRAIGGSDVELFFEIESVEKFLDVMKEMRNKFKEIIEWRYTLFTKYHKFNYFID